jgi:hypothetical protein
MGLQDRLNKARGEVTPRPDNDPDLCRLQALWVRAYGNEKNFEPVYQQFRTNPEAELTDYIQRYNLHGS